jgi:hypothetical protein
MKWFLIISGIIFFAAGILLAHITLGMTLAIHAIYILIAAYIVFAFYKIRHGSVEDKDGSIFFMISIYTTVVMTIGMTIGLIVSLIWR